MRPPRPRRAGRSRRVTLAAALLFAVGLTGALLVPDTPTEPEATRVHGADAAAALRAGQELCLLSWNVQFAAGRGLHFFYDGGPDVHVPEATVRRTLAAIGDRIQREAPDLLLLQEVDRDSRRTARIDQLPPLLEAAGARRWASAWYHRAPLVPHPLPRMLGRVDLHQVLASRFQMRGGERIPLPQLREGWLRRTFNLKRALLWAELPVEGWDRPLHLAVTHLSAFSRGDGTLARQVEILARWMDEREQRGQPYVLAGDMNLLPPGDDPARLPDGPGSYADDPNPMERLVRDFRPALPREALLDPAQRTYLPYGAAAPDRLIDWVFVGPRIEVLEAGPLPDPDGLSDHLAVRVRLRLVAEGAP